VNVNSASFARGFAVAACGLAALAFALPGCKDAAAVKPSQSSALSILALGDSYTIGEGVQENERWPMQLADRLRSKGVTVAAPVIIARTGWTTDELQAAVDRTAPHAPFALVTLLIGVNDQFRGREAEATRLSFRKILQSATALAGHEPRRVMVLSIPDWGVTPFAAKADPASIRREIDQFNHMEQEETARVGARYHDITGISREAKADTDLLAADQLHPSAKMYGRWVDAILAPAGEILGKK
jgi:lysophospholipase L1-like esterase